MDKELKIYRLALAMTTVAMIFTIAYAVKCIYDLLEYRKTKNYTEAIIRMDDGSINTVEIDSLELYDEEAKIISKDGEVYRTGIENVVLIGAEGEKIILTETEGEKVLTEETVGEKTLTEAEKDDSISTCTCGR